MLNEDSLKLQIKKFPNHRKINQMQRYNLYQLKFTIDQKKNQNWEETDNILICPVISDQCTTQCYFDISIFQEVKDTKRCPVCRKERKKFYIDVGYKSLLFAVRQRLITQKPLHIEINPALKKIIIPNIQHTISSAIADELGQQLLDQIGSINSKAKYNYSEISKKIEKCFNHEKEKNSNILYSWCRRWGKNTQIPQMLLFFQGNKLPIKAMIKFNFIQEHKNCSQYEIESFYSSCSVVYIGKQKTFLMALSSRKFTVYLASYVKNFSRQTKILQFQEFYYQQISRKYICSVVDQERGKAFFFGGFDDDADAQNSPNLIEVSNMEWFSNRKFKCHIHKNTKIFGEAMRKNFLAVNKLKLQEKRYQCLRGATVVRYCTVMQPSERINFYQQLQPTNYQWFSAGGNHRTPGGFTSGRIVSSRPGIRTITYFSNTQDEENNSLDKKQCIAEQIGQSYKFDFSGLYPYITEFPILGIEKADHVIFKNKLIVFGGVQFQSKKTKNDKVYLFNTEKMDTKQIQGDKLPINHMGVFCDHFTTLLFDPVNKLYLRYTIPATGQEQINNDMKLQYYVIQIFLKSPIIFKVTPGYLKIQ